MASSVDVRALQCQNIANALGQKAFADVTFVVGPSQTEFPANRLLFGVISDVFKAMLFGSMEESKSDSVITIDDIDAKGFKVVMDFAHCKNPQITVDNIISLKNICRKYQISSLSTVCDQRFKSMVNQHSLCSLLNESINYKIDEYVTECQNAVQTTLGIYAGDMVKSKGFTSMGLKAMIMFLQFDGLDITEEKLWDAVLEWNEYQNAIGHQIGEYRISWDRSLMERLSLEEQKMNDGEDNMNLLRAICPYIRFGLMNGTYFVDKVQSLNCLSKDETLEIANYILCDDKANRQYPFILSDSD